MLTAAPATESISPVKLICGVGSFTVVHLVAIIVAVNFTDSGGNPGGKSLPSLADWLLIQGFTSLGSCVIWLGGLIFAGSWRGWLWIMRTYVALVCLFMVSWVALGVYLLWDKNYDRSILGITSIITMVVQVVAAIASFRLYI